MRWKRSSLGKHELGRKRRIIEAGRLRSVYLRETGALLSTQTASLKIGRASTSAHIEQVEHVLHMNILAFLGLLLASVNENRPAYDLQRCLERAKKVETWFWVEMKGQRRDWPRGRAVRWVDRAKWREQLLKQQIGLKITLRHY
ncbi:unnamed protein product [Cyclocybe aegerita]|uniref:Uncharacterized protein n=1 Tax=Cyclocybe aegerita TaxID=1973307 RepID=A0A8S0VYT3_CYCAE|nr:unnamed protein product [Cyclocybe aegerita]